MTDCKHPKIIAWVIDGTGESAGLWSCDECDRKFYPAGDHPYPTADAYEAACAALHKREDEVKALSSKLDQVRLVIANYERMKFELPSMSPEDAVASIDNIIGKKWIVESTPK